MEEAAKDVIAKVVGESIQKSIEPFVRALLRSIKLIKDDVASVAGELEAYSRESASRLDALSSILQDLSNRVQQLESVQSERSLQPSIVHSPELDSEHLSDVIREKVRELVEPLEKSTQRILDQQLTLSKGITKVIDLLEDIVNLVMEVKSTISKPTLQFPAVSQQPSESPENLESVSAPSEEIEEEQPSEKLFSQLSEAISSLTKADYEEPEEAASEPVEAEEGEVEENIATGEPQLGEQLTPPLTPLASSQESSSPPLTTLEEITDEINRLENRLAEIDRDITDLTFDRMRGILTEEEYQEKKAALIKEKEELRKRIEQLISEMEK